MKTECLADACGDGGVTLVSYNRSRHSHLPGNHNVNPPKLSKRPARSRAASAPRLLTRLLRACAESEDELEDEAEAADVTKTRVDTLPNIDPFLKSHNRLSLLVQLPQLPDCIEELADVKLLGFKRSHSFNSSSRSSGSSCSCQDSCKCIGSCNGSFKELPIEDVTLKTSNKSQMDRERFRQDRCSDGGGALWPDKDEMFSEFLRQSHDRFNSLLEERGFSNIPPPAGFGGVPSSIGQRPTSLMSTLTRGPASLDEATLFDTSTRRHHYAIRRTATHQAMRDISKPRLDDKNQEDGVAIDHQQDRLKQQSSEVDDHWSDLPSSPLSPPSPFHHPFFRRQLGLPTPVGVDPWARFSGFGMPRIGPLLLAREAAENRIHKQDLDQDEAANEVHGDDEDEEIEIPVIRQNGSNNRVNRRSGGHYRVSQRQSVVHYRGKDHDLYKCCPHEVGSITPALGDHPTSEESSATCAEKNQFFTENFPDSAASETESDDEDYDVARVPHSRRSSRSSKPIEICTNSTSTHRPLQRVSSQKTSPSRNSSSSHQQQQTSRPPSSINSESTEVDSKRNSQAISTEPSELGDNSSVSELDSCHDPSSPRSSQYIQQEQTDTNDNNNRLSSDFESRKERCHRIALELLKTERTYVKVLHLIDQEFQFKTDQENRAHQLFPNEVIQGMFSNIKSIYKLHHDFLLPQLEERMAQWDANSKIGDIMKNFAPFLKMYTEYIRNFDNAMTLINQWQGKCQKFAGIMDEIHQMEACSSLTLQHHMLSPVQRIPRYEMMLRDYLKKLPDGSPDREDTDTALHLVSTAACHANDAMKKIDKFEKLLEIQACLGDAVDLVSPTRELVKEGKIIKISAQSGEHQERYIFLLTDLLLLCSPRLISGQQYRLRARYHVENLQVLEGDNLETANTFYIRDTNKSVELYTQTTEEKESWLEAFFHAIQETYQRKSSLKLHISPGQRSLDVDLGQKQPNLIRSDSISKCMECAVQFTMVRRKHHCRACGSVVCSKCSNFKAVLAYESGKSVRVCRNCHTTLHELSSTKISGTSPDEDSYDVAHTKMLNEPPDLSFGARGVLDVSAGAAGAVVQGFLQLKTHQKASKVWVRRWFALHPDFVLYSFKSDVDEQALTATPVPGFTVAHLQGCRNESGVSEKEKDRTFKLHHTKKHYIFLAASREESLKWVNALKKASQAELPSPVAPTQ